MSDEVYFRLREFLDRLPGAFPATESGIEIKLLKKLFTPEEARIAMLLNPLMPEPIADIAPRLGMSEQEAAEKVESMARSGLVFRHRSGGEARYMAVQFAVGLYEWQLNRMDREMAELAEAYLPSLTSTWTNTKTKQLRVVPVGTAIDATPVISSYDQIRELVKDKKMISLQPCICRKEQELLGHTCERPLETCLGFGAAAKFYVENGLGRQIGQDELMAIIELSEKHALVPSPTNAKDISFMCMCCGCCCAVLRGLKRLPRPADHVQSSFQAAIAEDRCSSCALCVDRCQMEAIKEGDGVYEVDNGRCIGCGLCVAACPDKAISMVAKTEQLALPANLREMSMRIAQERNLV